MEKVRYVVNLLIAFLLLASAVAMRDGKLFNHAFGETEMAVDAEVAPSGNDEQQTEVQVLETKGLVPGAIGYAGVVPLRIEMEHGRVTQVSLMPNAETPSFINAVVASGFMESWNGLTPEEVLTKRVDALSGATMSCSAIMITMDQAMNYVLAQDQKAKERFMPSAKQWAGLVVILMAFVLSIVKVRKKWLRWVQLLLNVVVLGFWCGSFLSLSLFMNWLSNGWNWSVALLPCVLFVLAVVMPLVGKKQYYCTWHCPMGAFQGLMGLPLKGRFRINDQVYKYLKYCREVILFALLFVMWLGVGFNLVDYEVFSAFLVERADIIVLVMAALFLVLSIFVNRPYCRFVCPTGALLTFTEKNK